MFETEFKFTNLPSHSKAKLQTAEPPSLYNAVKADLSFPSLPTMYFRSRYFSCVSQITRPALCWLWQNVPASPYLFWFAVMYVLRRGGDDVAKYAPERSLSLLTCYWDMSICRQGFRCIYGLSRWLKIFIFSYTKVCKQNWNYLSSLTPADSPLRNGVAVHIEYLLVRLEPQTCIYMPIFVRVTMVVLPPSVFTIWRANSPAKCFIHHRWNCPKTSCD